MSSWFALRLFVYVGFMGWVLQVVRVLWGEVLDGFVECYGFAMESLIDGVCNVGFMEDVMEWGWRSWL